MAKIFKVRVVPDQLKEEPRNKVVHLVEETTKEKHVVFPKDNVEVTKEQNSGWYTVKVK